MLQKVLSHFPRSIEMESPATPAKGGKFERLETDFFFDMFFEPNRTFVLFSTRKLGFFLFLENVWKPCQDLET